MGQDKFKFVKDFSCDCGCTHHTQVDDVIIEKGAIQRLPEVIKRYNGRKVFVLADENTYKAAGEKVCAILKDHEISYSKFVFQGFRQNQMNLQLVYV